MGIEKDQNVSAATELRRHAETQLQAQAPEAGSLRSDHELPRLLHELQVSQIELEMQNAELLQYRDEIETHQEQRANLYDFAPVGYFTLDHGGTIQSINLTGARFLGVDRARLIGRRFGMFVTAGAEPTFTAFLDKVFACTAKESCVIALLNEDNFPRFVQIEALVDATGQECRMALIDITERKLAEQALRESEARYRSVVEDQTEIICRFRTDGTITFVNDVFCRVFGKTRAELLGNTWQTHAVPEDLPLIEDSLRTLTPANPVVMIDNRVYTDAGAIRWMQFVNRGFYTTAGQLLETQAVGRDITERKQMELELVAIKNELERQVQERTHSLTVSNEQLQREIAERHQIEQELLHKHQKIEAMDLELSLAEERERDRIAGELHDQVGQRLIFGKMKLDALASRFQSDEWSKDVEELAQVIDLSLQDIRSLTFQLRPPLLASAGLEAALNWLGEEFHDKYGLQVRYADDGQLKPLNYAVRATVFQAVREILLNTVKHAGATQIGITIRRVADLLQVCISDNGCGFAVAETGKQNASSGGFGLINVQRRIAHLGGSIMIETRPGAGTSVTITTPLDRSQ